MTFKKEDFGPLLSQMRDAAAKAALLTAKGGGLSTSVCATAAAYTLLHVGVELFLAERPRDDLARWLREIADQLESTNDDGKMDA
jgi:hypothetical protein